MEVPEFETLITANTGVVMNMLKVFSGQMRRIHTRIVKFLETKEVRRFATAITLNEVTVIELSAQNFEPLILGEPQMAFKRPRVFSWRIYDSKRRDITMMLTRSPGKSRRCISDA